MPRTDKKLQLEKITAYDHWSASSWGKLEDYEVPVIITYVGWVIKEDRKFVYIAALRSSDGGIGKLGGIVKSAIIKRTKIKGGQ